MYLVRFIRSDENSNEEYYYLYEKDAVYHFNLFQVDDSKLYKSISLLHIHENNAETLLKTLIVKR